MLAHAIRSVFTGLVILFLAAMPLASAQADQAKQASDFIQSLGDRALRTLSDKSMTPEQAAKTFNAMLRESFDLDLIGKFALGANTWRAATPEQKQQYAKLFENLVIGIYSDRFKLYNGEKFRVVNSHAEDDRDTYVNSEILRNVDGAPPVQVDWRVRNRNGKPMVIDVIVEGVSMSVTQRAEFSSVLQQNGGDINNFLNTLQARVGTTPQL
jgi:phospholipid transport system substrate-binding protein